MKIILSIITIEDVIKHVRSISFPEEAKKLNTKNSKQQFAASQKYIPGGINGFKGPMHFVFGEYPIFLSHGLGSHVWDIDDNEYIDFMAAYGPVSIGYNEPEIDDAVINKIKSGFSFNLPQIEQNQLAEELTKIIPSAQQVLFAKTGTDAVNISIKLARAYTGKNRVLTDGYHGWCDFSMYDEDSGVLKSVSQHTSKIEYGDYESFEREAKKGDVAAILLTPYYHETYSSVYIDIEFIKKIRELSSSLDIPLIFDEVRTGFRVSLGGAQEQIGIVPDLSTFSKAIANGYAISAVTGGKKYMMPAYTPLPKGTFTCSTSFLNSLEITAAIKTIEFYKKYDVQSELNKKGFFFMEEIDSIIKKYKIPLLNNGIPTMPSLVFDIDNMGEEKFKQCTVIFYTYLIRCGIFMSPTHQSYIMYRHDEKDIYKALEVIEKAVHLIKSKVL